MRDIPLTEAAATLRQRGWLSRTPADFREVMLARCTILKLNAGEPVYYSGDEVGGIFGVIAGTVEIASRFGNPDAYVVHLAQSGFWMGEAALLAGATRFITAAARTDTALAFVPLSELRALVAANPEHWRYFGMLSLEHNNLATSAAADLLIRNVEHRCIAVLLRISGSRLRGPDNPADPVAVVTQEELAAMANLSRNAVGEVLRKLAERNMIELGYRAIYIKSPEALRVVVETG